MGKVHYFGDINSYAYVKEYTDTLSQDSEGIYTGTEVFVGKYGTLRERMINHDGNHTSIDWLKLTNKGFQKIKGGLGRCTLTFKGVPQNKTYIRYGVSATSRQENIATHPHMTNGKTIPNSSNGFSGKKAATAYGYAFGRPAVGKPQGSNQAYYEASDGVSKFKYFTRNAGFNLAGVEEYIDLGMTVNCTIISHASQAHETSISKTNDEEGGFAYKIGKRLDKLPNFIKVTQPTSSSKATGSNVFGYDWMVIGCDVDIIGSAMRQKVTFLLSNKKGWNPLIYPTDTVTSISDDTYGSENTKANKRPIR